MVELIFGQVELCGLGEETAAAQHQPPPQPQRPLHPKTLIPSDPLVDALQNHSCHRRHLILVHLGTPWYTVRSFFGTSDPWTILEMLITGLARGFRDIVVGLLCFLGLVFLVVLGFMYITSTPPWPMSTPTQSTTASTDTSSDTQATGQRSSRDDPPTNPSSTPHQTQSFPSTSTSTSTSGGREAFQDRLNQPEHPLFRLLCFLLQLGPDGLQALAIIFFGTPILCPTCAVIFGTIFDWTGMVVTGLFCFLGAVFVLYLGIYYFLSISMKPAAVPLTRR